MRLWILFTVICNCPVASLCCPVVGLCRQLTRFEFCFDYNWQFAYVKTGRTGGVELETGACYYDWFCCVGRLKTASTVSRFKRLYEDMSTLGKDTSSFTNVASIPWQPKNVKSFHAYDVRLQTGLRNRLFCIVCYSKSYFDARYSFSLFRCHGVLLTML